MGQIRQAFAQMAGGIREDFYRLRHGFTARSFFTLLSGVALLAANAYLFIASTVRMFALHGSIGWLRFAGGLFAFLVSCLLIFLLTVHFSVSSQQDAVENNDGGVFSEKAPFGKRGAQIASLILVLVITFGGGATALAFYISKDAKYSSYPQTSATVVSVINNGFDKGYTAVYEYTADGKTYRTEGETMGSGDAAPRIGDTVTVKYNPNDPNEIHVSTESKFLLAFGCFLVYFGLTVIAIWLYNAKKLRAQFLLAFILLGLTACIFVAYLSSSDFHGLINFFARNYSLHFIMIFTNVGILELINGIVYIGCKNRR